jgi:hypothetical protein
VKENRREIAPTPSLLCIGMEADGKLISDEAGDAVLVEVRPAIVLTASTSIALSLPSAEDIQHLTCSRLRTRRNVKMSIDEEHIG